MERALSRSVDGFQRKDEQKQNTNTSGKRQHKHALCSHVNRKVTGIVVGTRQAGLDISETADLLGFSHTMG